VIETGQDAPDFTLPDQDGKDVTLSGLRGSPVVLWFYPRASTPGCTTQACGLRDRSDEYDKFGAKVVGVSFGQVKHMKKFADENDLEFTLLADPEHEVAELYGVWGEKNMYGKTYMGVTRATFIIDSEGRVAKVFPKVSPKTHDDVVLEALAELSAA
jgi:peroxiredoxin Q/BCP